MSTTSDAPADSGTPTLLFVGGRLRVDGRVHSDIDRRVNETVGRLLQVKNLAVLVGAGASMHLGSPEIRHLSREAIHGLIDRLNAHVSEEVRGTIEVLAEDDDVDLEGLLSSLSTGLAYARSTGTTELMVRGSVLPIGALVETRNLINRSLALACDLPDQGRTDDAHREDPFHCHREFFRRLLRARRSDLPRIRVFTTNYDTIIERTLDEVGVPYFDGFVGTVSRVFRPEVFEQDIYLPPGPAERTLTRLPEVLYLYKLHGSVNWRSANSKGFLGLNSVVQQPSPDADTELALIYPTPQKEADVLGYPYSELFRALGRVVAASETCLLVLGYGFSDEHINRFIFEGLASSPTLQVFVVDPFAAHAVDDDVTFKDSVAGRLARLEDARVSVLSGELGKFVDFARRAIPDPDESSTDNTDEGLSEALGAILAPGEVDD